jgi:hypothetical protein
MARPLIQSPFVLRCVALLFPLSCGQVAVIAADDLKSDRVSQSDGSDIFNGRDLTGWVPVGKGALADWVVQNGSLICHGKGHTWLRSARQFGDFHLALEYQVSPGANSGVYVHVGSDGTHHRENASEPSAGFEVQILDDHSPRYSQLKDYQYSASLYDIAGATPRVSKPAGQWNSLDIECVGEHVTIRHNGTLVVDATPQRYPLLKLRNTRGFLGLQSHNGVVRFRHLRISPPVSRS